MYKVIWLIIFLGLPYFPLYAGNQDFQSEKKTKEKENIPNLTKGGIITGDLSGSSSPVADSKSRDSSETAHSIQEFKKVAKDIFHGETVDYIRIKESKQNSQKTITAVKNTVSKGLDVNVKGVLHIINNSELFKPDLKNDRNNIIDLTKPGAQQWIYNQLKGLNFLYTYRHTTVPIGIGLIPVAEGIQDIYETVRGKSVMGDQLSGGERLVSAVCFILPVSGKIVRTGFKVLKRTLSFVLDTIKSEIKFKWIEARNYFKIKNETKNILKKRKQNTYHISPDEMEMNVPSLIKERQAHRQSVLNTHKHLRQKRNKKYIEDLKDMFKKKPVQNSEQIKKTTDTKPVKKHTWDETYNKWQEHKVKPRTKDGRTLTQIETQIEKRGGPTKDDFNDMVDLCSEGTSSEYQTAVRKRARLRLNEMKMKNTPPTSRDYYRLKDELKNLKLND